MGKKAQSLPRHISLGVTDLRDRPVVIEGHLARESGVAETVVNRRYAVLYGSTVKDPLPVLASYRRKDDAEPSKCWALKRQCTLSDLHESIMRMRGKSTVAAVVGGGTPVQLVCFTLSFNSGKLWGSDRLTLCFESAEVARGWHAKLSAAIEGRLAQRSQSAPPQSPAGRATPRRLSSVGVGEAGASASEDQLTEAGSLLDGSCCALDSPTKQSMVGLDAAGDAAVAPRAWRALLHTNGVTVYAEEESSDGAGGGLMVSAVVRAPPSDTFKAIMQLPFSRDVGLMLGQNASVLEVIDAHTQVLHQTWRLGGLWGRLCAPRDLVLLRTWRQDRDGTSIVLYQTTQHGSAQEPPPGALPSWSRPVRAKIQAAGFTVAPLLPRFTVNGESPECLVTLVAKVDLGGWLAADSILGRVLSGSDRLWLNCMVQTVVALRDKVEQSRFVHAPSMEREQEDAAGPGAELQPALSASIKPRVTLPNGELSPLSPRRSQLSGSAGAEGGPGEGGAGGEEAAEPAWPQPTPEEEWAVNGTCHPCWTCPGSGGLRIRGKKYLQDKKKIPAALPMFDLYTAELLDVDEPLWHVARYLPSVKYCREPFMFIMQLMIPCSPPQSLTIVWTAPVNPVTAPMEELLEVWPEDEQGTVRAFFTNFKSFVEGEGKAADKRRNTKFKLIPNVVKGSWIVRQSVGTTPVLLGQKLLTRYFRGPNYFEVDVDITANTVAASITSLVVGAITSLVVDLNVLIEGQSEEELPERLAGSVRFSHLNLKNAAYLDEETGKIYRPQQV